MRPRAPRGEVAWGLKSDSTATTAATRAGSSPCPRAAALMSSAKGTPRTDTGRRGGSASSWDAA